MPPPSTKRITSGLSTPTLGCGAGFDVRAFKLNSEVWGIVLVLLLVLILDLLAIRAEKRARSFRNSSVPASVAAERLFSRLRARAQAQARFLISGLGFSQVLALG